MRGSPYSQLRGKHCRWKEQPGKAPGMRAGASLHVVRIAKMPTRLEQRERGGVEKTTGQHAGNLQPRAGCLAFTLRDDRKPLEDLEHRDICLTKLALAYVLRTDF